MKNKRIATTIQKRLARALPDRLQGSRPVTPHTGHGDCWPHSDGRQKTPMWQSPNWPTPGKNIPDGAQRLRSHFRNI